MGVGEMEQITGETGVGEMGVIHISIFIVLLLIIL